MALNASFQNVTEDDLKNLNKPPKQEPTPKALLAEDRIRQLYKDTEQDLNELKRLKEKHDSEKERMKSRFTGDLLLKKLQGLLPVLGC